MSTARTAAAFAVVTIATLVSCRGTTSPGSGTSPAHPRGVLGTPIATPAGRPFGIAISAAGQVYATLQDLNSVLPVDLPSATVGTQIPVGADPGDVVFDATGKTAYVSDYNDGAVHVINVSLGTSSQVVPVAANAYRLALAGTAQRLFVSSVDGHVYVVSTASMSVVDTIALGGALQGMALKSAGSALYVSSTRGVVFRIDATSDAVQDSVTVGGEPQDVALSPDGSRVYVANQTGWVDVLDAGTLASLGRYPVADAFGMRPTLDGTQLYVTAPTFGTVTVLDAATGSVLHTLNVGGAPRRVAFDAAGTIAVIANENNEVDVVN